MPAFDFSYSVFCLGLQPLATPRPGTFRYWSESLILQSTSKKGNTRGKGKRASKILPIIKEKEKKLLREGVWAKRSRPVAKASAQTSSNVPRLLNAQCSLDKGPQPELQAPCLQMPFIVNLCHASPPLLDISAASNDLSPGANSIDVQLRGCGYKKLSSSLLGPMREAAEKPSPNCHSSFRFPCALFRSDMVRGPVTP